MCIQGDAGSGKSSLFAKLNRVLHAQENENTYLVLSHAAGVSLRSSSLEALLQRWIQELAIHLELNDGDPAQNLKSFDEKKELFRELLSRTADNIRVICLIDAINQLERSAIARYMTWLPELWPDNARLVVTTIPGEESDVLTKRKGIDLISLPKLNEMEAKDLIKGLCKKYHKKLHPEIYQTLIVKELPDKSQACGNPLWLAIALKHLLLLDEDDFSEVEQLQGSKEEKLHKFILGVANKLPADIEDLYGSLFHRAHERFGKRLGIDWIPQLLDYLAISRYGLRESDIQVLLKRENDIEFALQFASVRRYLRGHIIRHKEQGLWDFAHIQERLYLHKGRLADNKYFRNCHATLANYLKNLSANDPLRLNEYIVHLIGSDNKQAFSDYLITLTRPDEIFSSFLTIANLVITNHQSNSNPMLRWIISTIEKQTLDSGSHLDLVKLYYENIIPILDINYPKEGFFTLLYALTMSIESLMSNNSKTDMLLLLARCYNSLAILLSKLGDQNSCLSYYLKSYNTLNKLMVKDNHNTEILNEIIILYTNIGMFYHEQEMFEDSLNSYNSAKKIIDRIKKHTPNDLSLQQNTAYFCQHYGLLLLSLNKLKAAKELLTESLKLTETFVTKDPNNYHQLVKLSEINNNLSFVFDAEGDFYWAGDCLNYSLNILNRLSNKQPDNVNLIEKLANAKKNIGYNQEKRGAYVEALSLYKEAITSYEKLIKIDSTNIGYKYSLAVALHNIGHIYQLAGKQLYVRDFYESALSILAENQKIAPNDTKTNNLYSLIAKKIMD